MDIDEKKHFLLILARDLHVDTNTVTSEGGMRSYAADILTSGVCAVQVMESIDLFRDNLRNVQDSDGEVDWKHEHIERYLRTYRNLASALTPLHEVQIDESVWITLFLWKTHLRGIACCCPCRRSSRRLCHSAMAACCSS